ncbi:MAG: MtrB/PioB family outer membrane beta-barrel protein [bacterium]|nr:MtrB/PioB family outer membrane beta-barrel protein [bacterium]
MFQRFITAIIILICWGSFASAQDATGPVDGTAAHDHPAGEMESHFFSAGYRFIDDSGSKRAGEYEFLEDSVSFAGDARLYSLPHRFHLDVEEKNRKDYFGELEYGYKDRLLFRWINTTLFHNLENLRLIDLDPITTSPGVSTADPRASYGVSWSRNHLSLKLKAPDFPLHLYMDGSLLQRDGKQQQRSLLGSGWFNNIVRNSQVRKVDWRTDDYTVGINSHLGVVEADYSHRERRFDSGGDAVLYDAYSNAGFGPMNLQRLGGEYPHNLVPEFKGSSDSLKIHTSYTGRLVGAATITAKKRENRDSGAKADYFVGTGGLTWMPIPKLTFFMKYKRLDRDLDNPETVTIVDRSDPANSYGDSAVRNSISSTTDLFSGSLRYRPLSGLTLRATYDYKQINRDHAEEWALEDDTRQRRLTVSGDARVAKGVKLKARYRHRESDRPAYNTDPHRSDEGEISVSWNPKPGINTLLRYDVGKAERNDLHFVDGDGNPIEGPENRENRWDRLLGSATLLVRENLSLTGSYYYSRNKLNQDLVYTSTLPPVFPILTDSVVPYDQRAQAVSFQMGYRPLKPVWLHGGVTHTRSRGDFTPNAPDLLTPVSVASFSDLKIRETVYSLSGDYEWRHGLRIGLTIEYSDFNDVLDNPNDDAADGIIRVLWFQCAKEW